MYIDSNYERVLNPGITNGTVMGTITPVVGSPFSVAAGCTPATYSSVSQCNTGYVFNKPALPGYDGSSVLTAPSQQCTVLCHMDRVAPTRPSGGLDCVFYCSGLGQQSTYPDYRVLVDGDYPDVVGLDYGWACFRSSYGAPRVWILELATVNAERVPQFPGVIPTPPTTVGTEPSTVGSCELAMDTNISSELTDRDPLEIGITANEPGFFANSVNGAAVHVDLAARQACKRFKVRTGTAIDGDYLPINLGPMQLGYVRGDLATSTNVNQPDFQARLIHSRGNHLHGRLRRLAIYPTVLTDVQICQILTCWATT